MRRWYDVALAISLLLPMIGSLPPAASASAAPDESAIGTHEPDLLNRLIAQILTDPLQPRNDPGTDASAQSGDAKANASKPVDAIRSLGDVDGDGVDDFIIESVSFSGPENRYGLSARSGSDPEHQFWNTSLPAIMRWVPTVDRTGDGVRDLILPQVSEATFSGTPTPSVPYVYAGSWQTEWTYPWDLVDGATGAATGTLETRTSYDELQASVFPPAGGAGYIRQGNQEYARLLPTGDARGTLIVATAIEERGYAAAYTSATSAYMVLNPSTTRFDLYDGDGTLRATFEAGNLTMNYALGEYLVDVTGDGVVDIVTHRGAAVPPGYGYPAGGGLLVSDAITAYDGVDGSKVWESEQGPGGMFLRAALPLGDLDGEPGVEIAIISLTINAEGGYDTAFVILRGGGGTLAAHEFSGIVLPLPFGDVDGDGVDEILRVDVDDLEAFDATIGVTGPDMEPRWTESLNLLDVGIFSFRADDPSSPALYATPDFDGDGGADLILATLDAEYQPTGLRLVRGLDGSTIWSATPPDDAYGVFLTPDADGTGDIDLLWLSAPDVVGIQNQWSALGYYPTVNIGDGRIEATLMRGQDGKSAWQRVLADAGAMGQADKKRVVVDFADLGSLQQAEVAYGISVRSGPEHVQDDTRLDGYTRIMVLDGATGRLAWSQPAVEADEQDAVKLEAFPQDAEEPSTPALSGLITLVGLLLAPVIARRRSERR